MADDFISTAKRVLRERPVDSHSIEHTDHHRRIVVRYAGKTRVVIFPSSSSDRAHGIFNFRAELNRTLNGLGVPKPDRHVSPHRDRTRCTAPRPIKPPVEKAVARADWKDALQAIAPAMFGGAIGMEA